MDAGEHEVVACPISERLEASRGNTFDVCKTLESSGCPLTASIEDRLHFESLLADLSATFVHASADEIDGQIESALVRLVAFLRVERGGLAELSRDRDRMVVTHSHHLPGVPRLPNVILNEQLPWYAATIARGEVFRVERIPDDLPAEATAERSYCTHVGLKSHVMIPLKVADVVVGAIGFGAFREYRSWSEELIQRLQLVGEVFANALARRRAEKMLRAREKSLRRTRRDLRRLAAKLLHAQEEERSRIAREMHDDWTQRLALLGLHVANLGKHVGERATALPLLEEMQSQIVALSEDVHALSRQLHPSILDDLGLVEALRSECSTFARREGIAIDYRADVVPRSTPREAALCLYRVAQEALRNMAKHAGVAEGRVRLRHEEARLVLTVEDRGVGIDLQRARGAAGLGLSSMQERVRLVAGRLTIRSAPAKGTTVEVVIAHDNVPL